jgi:hypothetical protein
MKNLKAPVQPRTSNKTPKRTFTVRLSAQQIDYINDAGGSKYLRELIVADMIKAGSASNESS